MTVTLIPVTRLRACDGALTDADIEDTVREAFKPHHCAAQFGTDAFDGIRRIGLRIKVVAIKTNSDNEYVVEGVRLAGLRRAEALKQYLGDVRMHLRSRGIVFTSPPRACTSALSMNDVRRRG